jgi:hypothetical protein
MEFSNDLEVTAQVEFLLKNCSTKNNIILFCSRVWCEDYHEHNKGTKGKTRIIAKIPISRGVVMHRYWQTSF